MTHLTAPFIFCSITQTAREMGCHLTWGRVGSKQTSAPDSSAKTALESGSRVQELRSFTSSISSSFLQGSAVRVLRSYRHSVSKHSIILLLTVDFIMYPNIKPGLDRIYLHQRQLNCRQTLNTVNFKHLTMFKEQHALEY